MSRMVSTYRVVIKIGGIRYYANKRGLLKPPRVSWHNDKWQLYLKQEAMTIADYYNDQKPEIEKISQIRKPEPTS